MLSWLILTFFKGFNEILRFDVLNRNGRPQCAVSLNEKFLDLGEKQCRKLGWFYQEAPRSSKKLILSLRSRMGVAGGGQKQLILSVGEGRGGGNGRSSVGDKICAGSRLE